MLLQFCTEMGFQITNTMFQMKDKFQTTWMHPGSKQWHFIDFLLVRRRDIADVQIVRVMRGAECWTNPRLVQGKLNFVVKPRNRSCGTKLPKRLNIASLKNVAVKEKLGREMENIFCENSWKNFKVSVYSACERILGFRKRKSRDWFDENDVTIHSLLESKSKAYNALSKCVTGFHELLSLKFRFNSIKTEIQRELRKMQNTWWSKRADEFQLAADTKNTRVFYSLLREVYDPSSFFITPLRSKDNKHLIRDLFGLLNRWKEHFDDLLNRPSVFNSELVESIPTKPVKDALGDEITAQEVEEAVQKLNSGKSPDMNGLLAEFFYCAGPVLMGRLTTLLQTAWRTEPIPDD